MFISLQSVLRKETSRLRAEAEQHHLSLLARSESADAEPNEESKQKK